MTASLSDARDALVNAVIDSLSAYRSSVLSNQQPGLMVPFSLRLFPLFVLALLKQVREAKPETDTEKMSKAKVFILDPLNIMYIKFMPVKFSEDRNSNSYLKLERICNQKKLQNTDLKHVLCL